ncbi:SMC-Scp complex subunit ScpB [Alkalinema sp. FACHB-956]|nr:SMC-Scp complex subunit ScpB [Alkalinema sp. FACHB-956]MBD2329120.1 SMC-Scp complex subunit ScpB [Alkalinema sp. FACHB-956]
MSRLSCTIEAILYLKAQPLSLNEIAECAGCEREAAEEGLLELMADFSHRETALEVAETPDGYCLQLRSDYQTLVQSIIPADIGVGALRTLAVIAMKGPIVQTELINLRGSSAYQQVQELVEQGFVRKRRRSDGRSYWLQVTDKFHQYFQLDQLQGNFDRLASATATPGKNATASKAGGKASVAKDTGIEDIDGIRDLEKGAEEGIEELGPLLANQGNIPDELDSDETLDTGAMLEMATLEMATPEIAGTLSDEVLATIEWAED